VTPVELDPKILTSFNSACYGRADMNRGLAALAIVLMAAAGCATRGSVRQTNADLTALRSEVTDLRQAQELSTRELGRTVVEMRALGDRMTALQASLRETTTEAARLRARAETAEQELRETKAAVASLQSPPAPSAATAPADRLLRVQPQRAGDAEQVYDAAMTTFRAREHGQAVLDLLDFIAKYPKHPLAPNAQYWIGEAYYAQRDYRQALVEFRRVLEMAPASPKAADALLKVGLCQSSLREHGPAQQTWQRVVRDYSGSEAAAKARTLLRQRSARRS
jgi:tol-pal system protein YbgF